MVKLGFIVEGATEKIILQESDFFDYLKSLDIAYVADVVNAEGNGNLLPRNIIAFTEILHDKGATAIFILTDLDDDSCITNTKARISSLENQIVTISVKSIEAWFLSDTEAMRSFLNSVDFSCEDPETINDPFGHIKSTRLALNGRGVSDKKILARLMIKNNRFSIQKAAQHPNCNSARYFLRMIEQRANNQTV